MLEVWRKIKGYEDLYEISNLGNVKSLRNNKTLKKKIDKYGYYVVNLSKKGIVKTKKIHRLVACAFIPNESNLSTVNHIDKNKRNNNMNNLEWMTNKENVRYSCSKKVKKYNLNGEFLEEYNSIQDACEKNKAYSSNISRCCKNTQNTTGGYKWKYSE